MKRAKFLALAIALSMTLSVIPFQPVQATGSYTEAFTVYFAGSSALWWMSFTGVNGSAQLSTVETLPGVNSYNVTAIRTTGWVSDFQVFGPNGYNLLPVPYVPTEGLFLAIGADTYSHAAAAAGAFDSYLLSNFVSLSNRSGLFEFQSSLSFNGVIPKTLLKLVPAGAGGFATAFSATSFIGLQSQTVIVGGVLDQSGFARTVSVGSITNKALDSNNQPNLASYFGTNNGTLVASRLSTSSTVHLKFLDGIVGSHDSATVTNHSSPFSADYSLALAPGKVLPPLNATVLEQPVQLLATRVVDSGVLTTGQNLSVSISLRNLSNSTSITMINLADDWWQGGEFRLASGSATVSNLTLDAGASQSPTYVLQYNGSSNRLLTIPSSSISYTYEVNGLAHEGRAILNPMLLSLGTPDPIIYATATPLGGYNPPVGGTQNIRIALRNVGTQTASSISVAGQTLSGIVPGGSATIQVAETAIGLAGVNITKSYQVTYKNPGGSTLNATSNVVPVIFGHSSMRIGFPVLTPSATISSLPNGAGNNLTLTFITTNAGFAEVTSFSARTIIPAGLGCGRLSGSGGTCSGGLLSLNYSSIPVIGTEKAYMMFNVTNPANYVIPPFVFQGTSSGLNVHGESSLVAAPSGFVITKAFSPQQLFRGMQSTVSVSATNSGPSRIFNATASTGVDTFDSLKGISSTAGSKAILNPGERINFSYTVKMSSLTGTSASAPVTTTLFFGARQFTVTAAGPLVSIYESPSATIKTIPASPIEGRTFTLMVTLKNPSGVQVTNVLFTLPMPTGLTLSQPHNSSFSNGLLSVSVPSLSGGTSFVGTVNATAGSGIAVPFAKAALTFSFAGVTGNGKVPTQGFVIGENITIRYLIPTSIVFVVLFAAAYYLRRIAAPIVAEPQN